MTRKPPDESRLSGSARLQDLPGYQEMASSEAFRKARGAKAAPVPSIRIRQVWIAICDGCGRAVDPGDGPFESQQEADEAKRQHLDEHARGEWT